MNNNLFTALIAANQIQTNRRLAHVQANVNAQTALLQQAQNERDRIKSARQMAFDFRTALEEAHKVRQEHPAWTYVQLVQGRMAIEGKVSRESFSEFQDLEYWNKVEQVSRQLDAELVGHLGGEAVGELRHFVLLDKALPEYAAYAAWVEIANIYQKGRRKVGPGIAFAIGLAVTLCVLGASWNGELSLIVGALAAIAAFVLGRGWSDTWERAQYIASQIAWNVDKKAHIAGCQEVIAARASWIRHFGFSVPEPKEAFHAYEERYQEAEGLIVKYGLPLVMRLPRRIDREENSTPGPLSTVRKKAKSREEASH